MGANHTPPQAEGHLQQRLSLVTMMAMSFAILNTWIALAGTIGFVLPSGGSISLVYGFLFCVLCNLALTASLGELAALWPTAGGQYHFVFALCTERWKRVMSFWVGWTNIGGWLTIVTAQGFFGAQFVSAAAVVASNGAFELRQWTTYLIFLAILTFATAVNIWGNRMLGRWNDAALYWSLLGVVIISIVLLSMSDKTEPSFVFANFQNATGWPDGVSWLLGLTQSALSLIGFDVVMHMAEEMPNPSTDVPRAMIYSIIIGGTSGIAFILVMLFCFVDPATVLGTSTGMPIVELILQATKSRAAATILALMLTICFINGTIGSVASASRLVYAMARDEGLPRHSFFSHIDPKLNVPIRTIVLCYLFNVAFGLLYLGPSVAFNAYTAACTIFLNISYSFPIIVLLVRGRDVLKQHQSVGVPFKLGKWGYFLNWTAALYVVIISIFYCFPPGFPVSPNTMNYVSAVLGIFFTFVAIYWFMYGNTFKGPTFDIIIAEHLHVGTSTGTCSAEQRKQEV